MATTNPKKALIAAIEKLSDKQAQQLIDFILKFESERGERNERDAHN
jgi:hypothetical protein